MKRITSVAIMMLIAFTLSVVAVAEDAEFSFCGTFSGSASIASSTSTSVGSRMQIRYLNLTAITDTRLAMLPTSNVTQAVILEYSSHQFTLGSECSFGLIPVFSKSLGVYARMDLEETPIGDRPGAPTLQGYYKANVHILPAFLAASTFYISFTSNLISASSRSVFSLAPVVLESQQFDVRFDFRADKPNRTSIGIQMQAFPDLATAIWLDVFLDFGPLTWDSYTNFDRLPLLIAKQDFTLSYSIEDISLTSRTTFDYAIPHLRFKSEYLRISAEHKGLSTYGWGQFAAGGPSLGIGFSYNFCTGSN